VYQGELFIEIIL